MSFVFFFFCQSQRDLGIDTGSIENSFGYYNDQPDASSMFFQHDMMHSARASSQGQG